jgi:hypothetical protein
MSNTVSHQGRTLVSGLTALGSSQTTAFPLINRSDNQFTTVASSTGAILPTAKLPDSIAIWNGGANTLSIYPPSGGTINDGTTNVAVTLLPLSGIVFFAADLGKWYSESTSSSGTVSSIIAGAGLSGGTITTSGTIALASIASATILANVTVGSAAPVSNTLTALIDAAIASVQGDILYRGATAWSALAPGTTGQLLATQGAGANPQWANATAGGTVTSVAATVPVDMAVTGSPVTSTGTLAIKRVGPPSTVFDYTYFGGV